jgi:hypothetical protein
MAQNIKVSRLPRVAPASAFSRSRYNEGGGSGPRHDFLGLGLPLVWWGVALFNVGGLVVNGYNLATSDGTKRKI